MITEGTLFAFSRFSQAQVQSSGCKANGRIKVHLATAWNEVSNRGLNAMKQVARNLLIYEKIH
jgi:hypothetical protein